MNHGLDMFSFVVDLSPAQRLGYPTRNNKDSLSTKPTKPLVSFATIIPLDNRWHITQNRQTKWIRHWYSMTKIIWKLIKLITVVKL